jgi:hypothetical protein
MFSYLSNLFFGEELFNGAALVILYEISLMDKSIQQDGLILHLKKHIYLNKKS